MYFGLSADEQHDPCGWHACVLQTVSCKPIRLYALAYSIGMPVDKREFRHTHTVFQVRFRLIRLPVVRKPLSPIAPRHSMDSWPNVTRPSRLRSFCRPSRPSCRPSSCSTRNATCNTSRGLRVGGADSLSLVSQLRD